MTPSITRKMKKEFYKWIESKEGQKEILELFSDAEEKTKDLDECRNLDRYKFLGP